MRKPVRKKRKPITEPTRPEFCGECKRVTTNGGMCIVCTLNQRAAEKAAAAPPPPPEPPPEPAAVLRAAEGCYRCSRPGVDKICGGCAAVLFDLPRRSDDPIIRYPKPCNRTTGW
jgi:hypothetical protein